MNPGKKILKQDTTSIFKEMPTIDEDVSMRTDFINQVEKDQCIRIFDGVNTEELFKKKRKEVVQL